MVNPGYLAWQNKSIAGSSDFRGVLILGLLSAWFYFIWLFLSLPPLDAFQAGLPLLLRAALAKGRYMPDFGMMVAGAAAFHFRRELRKDWEPRVAWRTYLSAVLPLIAYLALGVALLEAVHLTGPAHAFVAPWRDPLMRVQFIVLVTAIVFACLWPAFLFWMWTSVLDIGVAGVAVCLIYFGMNFSVGGHKHLFMWPANAVFSFVLGVCLCTSMFRGVQYLSAVRGQMIIFGWLAMLACSILAGPGLFFIGFLMILAGSVIGERSWFLPGERMLLIWSRTALALVVVQPALFAAWVIWGQAVTGIGWLAVLVLAIIAQILATVLCLVVEMPARRLTPVMPA